MFVIMIAISSRYMGVLCSSLCFTLFGFVSSLILYFLATSLFLPY